MLDDDNACDVPLKCKAPPTAAEQKQRAKQIKATLRGLHIGLGLLCLLAAGAAWFVIFFFGISTDLYTACFYMLIAKPAVPIPTVLSLRCLSTFLVSTITLALYALIYHLFTINFFFDAYITNLANGRYDNPYRWIFRGATVPTYLMLALHASGVRSAPTAIVLMMMAVAVELLRWLGERRTTYKADKDNCYETISIAKSGSVAIGLSLFIAMFVFGAQIAYWVFFLLADIANVPLMTWLVGPAFALYYVVYALWTYVNMTAVRLPINARMDTEYLYIVYDTVFLIILTLFVILGSIFP